MTNIELFSRLILLMDLADRAYENYMANKLYLHAVCIRKNNAAIYNCIIEHADDFPKGLYPHLLDLLNHYDTWMAQFDLFQKTKVFSANEPFIFYHVDAKSAYPKTAALAIRDYGASQVVS